ncbi:hypothetical protein [Thermodesulfovibrio yellowstonii]|uniref:hypothetical protein n=1 Tax=Thermodesulfovibrio yellowstonii TaxID=28262 RepID=UPI00041927AF|nr:hypothetical protein [Thermodesulfovibrio islandicus]
MRKEIELFCFGCKKRTNCKTWKQILNFDDSFMQSAFDYDRQEIAVVVTACEDYQPEKTQVDKATKDRVARNN